MNGLFQNLSKNIKHIAQLSKARINGPVFSRLSTRLLFTLTMLSALPLIVVGLFMRSVTQESISDYINNQNTLIARRAGNEIRLFLDTPDRLLKILVETRDIIDMNPFAQKLILNKFLANQPIFDRIFTVDTLGNEVTTSDFSPHIVNHQHEQFYTQTIEGNDFLSEVNFNQSQEPFIILSKPIFQFGQVVGILVAEINLKSIWDLVDEIRIGASGYAFVVDGAGQLIAHPDKKKVIDQEKVIDLNLIREVKQDTILSRRFVSPEETEMVGTIAYLGDLDWVIIIQQPVDEAFAVANTMLYQVFAFVALVILIAVLFAYLLEKRITAPINTLIDGVKKYAEGDLDFRITIEKYEEIAVLAREFNAMAANLFENQRKLRRVERLAAMSRFATLVSHEIRNPLNSMNINMQILKREMENPRGDTEKRKKYFDIITSEINRMENLIKNFLMISRPPRFDFFPHNVHDILDEVILMHSANADQQKVKLIKKYYHKKILAGIDRDQMKQVFHNILINGLQAMPEGGILTVKTGLKRLRNHFDQKISMLRIEFADTGVGIPKDKLKDIFELYYTMKKTGTGLGLAIARQIIEGHHGTINVKSELDVGTRIIIDLPIKSGQEMVREEKYLILES